MGEDELMDNQDTSAHGMETVEYESQTFAGEISDDKISVLQEDNNMKDTINNNDSTGTHENLSDAVENNNLDACMQHTISDPQSESSTPLATDSSNTVENVTMECKDNNIQSEDTSTALCNSADNTGLIEVDQDEVINPTKDINEDLEEGECTSDEEEIVPVVQEPIKQES